MSRPGSVASYALLVALLSLRDVSLSAVRSFLLLTMTLTLIASPRPGKHVTFSYAQPLTHGIVRHNSSDGAISPPCDTLPLRLSVLSVLVVQDYAPNNHRFGVTNILNYLQTIDS